MGGRTRTKAERQSENDLPSTIAHILLADIMRFTFEHTVNAAKLSLRLYACMSCASIVLRRLLVAKENNREEKIRVYYSQPADDNQIGAKSGGLIRTTSSPL